MLTCPPLQFPVLEVIFPLCECPIVLTVKNGFCSITGGLNYFDYVLPLACLTVSLHTCLTYVNFHPSDNYHGHPAQCGVPMFSAQLGLW
jgi:hypothetical protein